MDSEPPAESKPAINPPPAKSRYFPYKPGCAYAVVALVVLGFLIPPFGRWLTYRAGAVRSLHTTMSIALALKLYASDNDGRFPTAAGDPASEHPAGTATNANEAFANLFPIYVNAEKLFYQPGSAYCNPSPPDEDARTRATCLAPGENDFGYVTGLTDKSNAALPLIVTGTDGTGHYVSDKTRRGGVWMGKWAVVVHVDSSGETANLAGPGGQRFIPRSRDDKTDNLLDPAYLDAFHAHLLDPAMRQKAEGRR